MNSRHGTLLLAIEIQHRMAALAMTRRLLKSEKNALGGNNEKYRSS
jgi:hypothetical protein